MIRCGAGEAPFDVAEQFALHQFTGNGAAVDGYEILLLTLVLGRGSRRYSSLPDSPLM